MADENRGMTIDPGAGAAELAGGAIGTLREALVAAIKAAKHAKNVALIVPNTVLKTGDKGFDLVADNIIESLEKADDELSAGVSDLGQGLPDITVGSR